MKKKIPILILIVVAVAAALVYRQRHGRTGFLFAGSVEATEVDLSSRLSATIAGIAVKEGAEVHRGDALVTLSGEDFRIAAAQAKGDFERAKRLLKTGAVTAEAFDRARFKWEDAALRASWLEIASPIDGTVLDRFHEPGELVGPGTRILKLANLSDIWARVYVPQTALARLQPGMAVEAFLPELDMKRLEGKITHIRDEAEFTPKNVQTRDERARLVYAVKVSFPNADRLLKPGMTVEVRLPE